ncbi:tuftelin-interacting protein 11-like isoform X1 [Prorops nasuta]|uniref:tuftelin-interacting protein 11-like isoform X1 n=1 Tax=Prorops nasuta TaxID=863751 RepID=UPI0034CD83E6
MTMSVNSEYDIYSLVDQNSQLDVASAICGIYTYDKKSQEADFDDELKELLGLTELFGVFQDEFYEQYRFRELQDVAVATYAKRLKVLLKRWDPLIQPNVPFTLFEKLKVKLEDSLYGDFIAYTLFPSVDDAIKRWECREPEPLINFIQLWTPLLPQQFLNNILDSLVMPKLLHEVENWDPSLVILSFRVWIDPWESILGKRLDISIYPIIDRKLEAQMSHEHASEMLFRQVLQTHCQEFLTDDLENFLVENILPKLQNAIRELQNDHFKTRSDKFNCFDEWIDLLPLHITAKLLHYFFFPFWLNELILRLDHFTAYSLDYVPVGYWFVGWREMFSQEILKNKDIECDFTKGAIMVNRVVQNPYSPYYRASQKR